MASDERPHSDSVAAQAHDGQPQGSVVPPTYNVYCDESGHLEHDNLDRMVLGAVWCPEARAATISAELNDIKVNHGLDKHVEMKWQKLSNSKVSFYLDVLEYFFQQPDLHFRALVAADKQTLSHRDFEQNHDEWYYKMYYVMLKPLFEPDSKYRVYLDIKDTQGISKVRHLHRVIGNSLLDFERSVVTDIWEVRSHQVTMVQLTDLLIGAVQYANRDLQSNSAKVAFIERLRAYSGYSLTRTTLYREQKVNIFVWHPQNAAQ